MPLWLTFFCSWIKPASSTVWPDATWTELLTLRCEMVGVRFCEPGGGSGDLADLLLDFEPHEAVGADARHHAQDDSGAAIIDRIDDRVGGGEHVRGAG